MASGDVAEKEAITYSVTDSLLDIHEKEGLLGDKEATQDPDVEVGLPKPEPSTEDASPPQPARAPLSREEALTLRIKSLDNIRALTLCIIFIHNAAVQAISTHPQAAQLHETNPKAFIVVTLFSAMARLLTVPMLLFVAGFRAQFTIVMHGRSPLRFVIRRAWKSALTILAYQVCVYLAKTIRPLPPIDTLPTTPYYASREGIEALLNGPTAYILLVFTLDCLYALFRAINVYMASTNSPTHLITSKLHYEAARNFIVTSTGTWVIILGAGLSNHILEADSVVKRWLYAINATELYTPFFYLFAYIAGVHFVHYYKYILWTPEQKAVRSPSTFFLTRVAVSFTYLAILCYGTRFSKSMTEFLDPRRRPSLVFTQSMASPLYGIWVFYVLAAIPPATINLSFNSPALISGWDRFARHAPLQVCVQMVYVVGNRIRFFDGLFARWAFIAWMGIWYAHYLGVGGVVVGNLLVRLWDAVRSRFGRTIPVQPLSI